MIGVVKWFNPVKGYGFVKTDDREVFIHKSQIGDLKLIPGQLIEFDLYETVVKGKPQYEAKNVTICNR